jgi:hypothetical protein
MVQSFGWQTQQKQIKAVSSSAHSHQDFSAIVFWSKSAKACTDITPKS